MKPAPLLLLVVAAAACQPSTPPAADAPVRVAPARPPAPVASAATIDSVAPATLALLHQHDLAPLWAGRAEGKAASHAMEGFYGAVPYRISFYFTSVVRDAQKPTLFHVAGLDRYRKVITPFSGTIQVQDVHPFADSMWADVDTTAQCFTATARFILREDPHTKGAGNYTGQAFLDFYLEPQGKIGLAGGMLMDAYRNPTRGSGLLFRGTQVSNATGRRQPVAFANSYVAVVPQVLSKLGLGDRSEEINPNLARLGWNEAWENEEWWARSPKPSLGL